VSNAPGLLTIVIDTGFSSKRTDEDLRVSLRDDGKSVVVQDDDISTITDQWSILRWRESTRVELKIEARYVCIRDLPRDSI
jgi:hypothetical protein